MKTFAKASKVKAARPCSLLQKPILLQSPVNTGKADCIEQIWHPVTTIVYDNLGLRHQHNGCGIPKRERGLCHNLSTRSRPTDVP